MMNVDLSPEALGDLEYLKSDITFEFGEKSATRVLKGIMSDLHNLELFPDSGSNEIFRKFNIDTDYLYLVTHKNLAFYRIEGERVRIIRILDERRDIIYVLFGIKVVPDDSDEDFWLE